MSRSSEFIVFLRRYINPYETHSKEVSMYVALCETQVQKKEKSYQLHNFFEGWNLT